MTVGSVAGGVQDTLWMGYPARADKPEKVFIRTPAFCFSSAEWANFCKLRRGRDLSNRQSMFDKIKYMIMQINRKCVQRAREIKPLPHSSSLVFICFAHPQGN